MVYGRDPDFREFAAAMPYNISGPPRRWGLPFARWWAVGLADRLALLRDVDKLD